MGMADVIDGVLTEVIGSQKYGAKLLHATGVDRERLLGVAPVDDGVAPNTPTGLTTTAFIEAVALEWNSPLTDDAVESSVIEYNTVTEPLAKTVLPVPEITSYSVFGLDSSKEYVFRVASVDMWGKQSGWSASSLPIKPLDSAQTLINKDKQGLLLEASNLMDNLNAQLIDPFAPHFAEGVVSGIALAQGNNTNILTLREVDFDQWRPEDTGGLWNGTWPPPLRVGSGDNIIVLNEDNQTPPQPYITAVMNGHTSAVQTIQERKWLNDFKGPTATADWISPFSNFALRGTYPNKRYIFSAYVKGVSGTTVRLAVEGAADSLGTNASIKAIGGKSYTDTDDISFTLTGNPNGERVWLEFQTDNITPYLRFRLYNDTLNATVYWTKFQLEETSINKHEPTPWSPGIFTTGVIAARMIGTIDLVASRAIFKTAVIESAAIKDLTASKIVTGTLQAATSISCAGTITASGNGKIVASGAELTTSGLSLTDVSGGASPPDAGSGDKITPKGASPWAAMHFFNQDTGTKLRGVNIAADGLGGGSAKDGQIRLAARAAPNLGYGDVSSAVLSVESVQGGLGRIATQGKIVVDGDVQTTKDFVTTGGYYKPYRDEATTLGAGSSLTVPVRSGDVCKLFMVLARTANDPAGNYYQVTDGDKGLAIWTDASSVFVVNNSAANRPVKVYVYG